METIQIRPVVSRMELERAYDIWGTVFAAGRSFFQERLDYDDAYAMDTTWIALVDGEIAAAIQIFPYRMRYGSVQLKVGGIGSVATSPEYRKRGLAQRILRCQSEYMEDNGYDASLLFTGIHSFYEQVGWVRSVNNIWNAKASELKLCAFETSGSVRTYEDADLTRVMDIYEEMNSGLTGSMIRTKAYWQGQSQWKAVKPEHFLVAEGSGTGTGSGNIMAYMRYKIRKDGQQLQIAECCYESGQEKAALSLLQGALDAQPDVQSVQAALPAGHALLECFRGHGTSGTTASAMWKSFDIVRLLTKLAPELTRRVRQSSAADGIVFPVALLIGVGEQEAVLRIREEEVEVVKASAAVSYHLAVHFSEAEWITLLLKGCDALEKPPSQGHDYLRILFPETPYIFWSTDNF
ncbi:GNAT family N-acetyltransferase [Paenibacillus allorhizosphaerae]|uniref:N-acetyltransferase Eis n=1 Tax=Paenibacillus allorhizosphaerae TaxID=2849866 RepID=A0ABM8VJ07_9BACL|nr:GNAT family N-acetyltransferase [Paenibacillus allorhizosphaerae]CAG7644875.1 N-acetyltransferase Eis [Paenibacillus allorhizosphaerae]